MPCKQGPCRGSQFGCPCTCGDDIPTSAATLHASTTAAGLRTLPAHSGIEGRSLLVCQPCTCKGCWAQVQRLGTLTSLAVQGEEAAKQSKRGRMMGTMGA